MNKVKLMLELRDAGSKLLIVVFITSKIFNAFYHTEN